MKKIAVILVMVGLLAGCAGNSFFCRNKDIILAGLQFVITQSTSVIDSIKAQYPNLVPPGVQAVLDKAQQAHDAAVAASAQACPVVADLTAAQAQMTQATQAMTMAGMKVGK